MAKTFTNYTGDGVRTSYPVSFDLGYISRDHVYVYSGEHDTYETQLGYSWISDTSIELDEPVENGVEFFIRRVVPRNAAVNDYEDGAILRESNLDASFAQALMILEEVEDGFIDPETEFVLTQEYLDNRYFQNVGNVFDYGLVTSEVDDMYDYGGI